MFSDDAHDCNQLSSNVLHKFTDYLSDSFVSNVKQTVSLNIDADAVSVFCKALTIPIRLKDKVKTELDRLVTAGIISKILSSDWASSTVNVCKNDGAVRICGDYSPTINRYLDIVNSPLPTMDNIAEIGTVTVFSKLDLHSAFFCNFLFLKNLNR